MNSSNSGLSLDSLERLHGEELARISHALRTPLTSIIGFSSAILNDPAMERETLTEFMKVVKSEGERLSRFVEELLYVSFSDPQQSSVRGEATDVRELIHTALRVASTRLNQPASRFDLTFDAEVGSEFLDREFMLKMLAAIIGSAVRFSPHYLPVKIAVTRVPGALGLRVESRRRGGAMNLRLAANQAADVDAAGLSRTRFLLELRGGTLSAHQLENGNTAVLATFPLEKDGDL